MRNFILGGLLVGLLLAAAAAWSVLRRDTLQATPHGYKLPSLVVTGTSEFDGAVTLPTGDVTGTEILDGTVGTADIATDGVDSAEVGDVDATVLWKSVMTTAGLGIDQESTVEIKARGLTVPTLSSGTLYIYLCDE